MKYFALTTHDARLLIDTFFFLSSPFFCSRIVLLLIVKETTHKAMAAAAAASTSTAVNDLATAYHTVTICADLPKISRNKYDYEETSKDLSLTDYWLKEVDSQANNECYKIRHIISNGPRRLDKLHCRRFINFFVFRHIFA
jgi:hypothetical protein